MGRLLQYERQGEKANTYLGPGFHARATDTRRTERRKRDTMVAEEAQVLIRFYVHEAF